MDILQFRSLAFFLLRSTPAVAIATITGKIMLTGSLPSSYLNNILKKCVLKKDNTK